MNVKTGAILAMASKPDFDPNDPQDFSANLAYLTEQVQAEPELYTIYKKDENGNYLRDENGQKIADAEADYTGTYRDIQWKNKTITELYYPGSVFKVITAAMGVDSGKATYYTTLNCSGAYSVAKQTYHCAGRKSHGAQNLAEALRNSCNIYFVQLGQRVVPACSMITLMPSALPSAPVWTCPMRPASCSITAKAVWARWSWPPPPLVRPWP